MGEDQKAGAVVSQQMIARIVMVVVAALLVVAFFLPWASAEDEFREAAANAPETMFYEPTGMTVADAADLSLFEYAQVYGSMGGTWRVYMVIMYIALATAIITLLFSSLGKPIAVAIFGIATFAISRLLVWDFGDRGILPNGTHDWGLAPNVYLVAVIVLVAAAIWLFLLKRREKIRA